MTVDELLALARATPGNLASAVIDLLAEAEPCGMPLPDTVPPPGDGTDGVIVIHEETAGVWVAADARHLARALLRAADEVEAK